MPHRLASLAWQLSVALRQGFMASGDPCDLSSKYIPAVRIIIVDVWSSDVSRYEIVAHKTREPTVPSREIRSVKEPENLGCDKYLPSIDDHESHNVHCSHAHYAG